MLVLRPIGILVLLAIVGAITLYLFTRNRRYLTVAWRVFQFAFAFVFLVVFLVLYLLERLVLVI